MKDLIVSKEMTLTLPDSAGDVGIDFAGCNCQHYKEVSFEKLEKWVASIREQIITVATSQEPCSYCEYWKSYDVNYDFCPYCGMALDR